MMTQTKTLVAILAAVGALGGAGAASASTIDFWTTTGPAVGATVDGFNGQSLSGPYNTNYQAVLNVGGGTLTLDGAQIVHGSASGEYAAPWALGTGHADNSKYVSVYSGGSATFTLNPHGSGAEYIGLDWGSVDTYNTITFETETKTRHGYVYTPVESFTGAQVIADADGNQGPDGTIYANFTSSVPIYRVVISSSGNSFEFDKLAFDVHAVPLPAALPLFGAGLAGLGALGWRRRKA